MAKDKNKIRDTYEDEWGRGDRERERKRNKKKKFRQTRKNRIKAKSGFLDG